MVGTGGLGSAIIFYLASSGVGTIAVADNDIVELYNLQRQIIHNELDIGIAKVESAKNKIKLLNSTTNFIAIKQEVTKDNKKNKKKFCSFLLKIFTCHVNLLL